MNFYEQHTTLLRSHRDKTPLFFPFHMHIAAELIYVTAGELRIDYPDKSEILRTGDFAVIFPYTIHGYTTLSKTLDYNIAICSKEITSGFNESLFNKSPEATVINSCSVPPDIQSLMYELAEYNGQDNYQLIKAISSLILARILPLLTLQDNSMRLESNLTVQAVSFVFEHFREDISLETLAKVLGVSRYTVSRIFTSVVKVNFVNYVNTMRIDCAKELLTTTTKSIAEIGLESGFDCIRSFNRIFKKHVGVSPLQYRKSSLLTV